MSTRLLWQRSSPLARALGWLLAVAVPIGLTYGQTQLDNLRAPLFGYFFTTLLITRLAGLKAGFIAALCSTLLANFHFFEPIGTLRVSGMPAATLGAFLVVTSMSVWMLHALQRYAAERAALLEQSRAALELRDNFLAVAGHELKTPLTALLLRTQLLLKHISSTPVPTSAESERWQHHVADQVLYLKRINALVEQLLDVSHLTRGTLQLTPEEVDIDQLVAGVVEQYSDTAARAGCALSLVTESAGNASPNPNHQGYWDRLRAEQVISNLLGNAVKYGAGSAVQVCVKYTGQRVAMSVRDHGQGIPDCEHARIFERFTRLDSTRAMGGLGLGLWIVREIVAAGGGTVHVESVPGEGATFTATLPRRMTPDSLSTR